jgi:hypothetical protein
MNYSEYRELRSFVANLTAKTKTPWCLAQDVPGVGSSPLVVRIDPLSAVMRGEKLSASEIMRFPSDISIEVAKTKIIERLAQESEPNA